MAGSKVNNYAIGDVNLTSVMSTLDDTRIGYCAVSLTNYATTGVPAIAAGSKVEVDGALFKFDSEEAIGGSPSDGTVYIKLVPAGSSITAEFTNTAPSWSTEKQGWYSPTAGEESYRYLPFGMTKSGSSYSGKYEITPRVIGMKKYSDGKLGGMVITGGASIDKLSSYATGFVYIGGVSAPDGGTYYTSQFYITKPGMFYFQTSFSSSELGVAQVLVYVNGGWYRAAIETPTETKPVIALNPGLYVLSAYYYTSCSLYCVGAYGVDASNFNAASVTT